MTEDRGVAACLDISWERTVVSPAAAVVEAGAATAATAVTALTVGAVAFPDIVATRSLALILASRATTRIAACLGSPTGHARDVRSVLGLRRQLRPLIDVVTELRQRLWQYNMICT